MEPESRRRAPRRIAGWMGFCRVEDDPVEQSWPCRVLDVSELGVGAELEHPLGVVLLGHRVVIETPTMGRAVTMSLQGDVRNVTSLAEGSVRLGIEFVGLTQVEQSVAKALGLLDVVP